MTDILYRPAFELAADIKAGKLSASAVLEFFLDRVNRINPALNAVVALDEALNQLSEFDPQKCRIIELRFFGGLTIEETAELLDLTNHKVWQETQLAKAWLFDQLSKGSGCAG